jgi:hypothetical protein
MTSSTANQWIRPWQVPQRHLLMWSTRNQKKLQRTYQTSAFSIFISSTNRILTDILLLMFADVVTWRLKIHCKLKACVELREIQTKEYSPSANWFCFLQPMEQKDSLPNRSFTSCWRKWHRSGSSVKILHCPMIEFSVTDNCYIHMNFKTSAIKSIWITRQVSTK